MAAANADTVRQRQARQAQAAASALASGHSGPRSFSRSLLALMPASLFRRTPVPVMTGQPRVVSKQNSGGNSVPVFASFTATRAAGTAPSDKLAKGLPLSLPLKPANARSVLLLLGPTEPEQARMRRLASPRLLNDAIAADQSLDLSMQNAMCRGQVRWTN